MMRLMRSLVWTQALPLVEFELSTLGLGQNHQDRGRHRSGKMSFSHQPTRNEIQSGCSRPLHVATIERVKFTQKERRFISKSFGKQ